MKVFPSPSILVAIMSSRENTGMALGLLGVVIFSLTLPFTRIVVQELHPLLNGLQPLCVALYAAWLSHERPSKAFWACAALGSALVLGLSLIHI